MAITLVEGFKYIPGAASRIALVNAASGVSTWSRVAGRSAGCYALRHTHSTATGSNVGSLRVPVHNKTFSIGFATLHPNVTYGAATSSYTGVQLWAQAQLFFITALAVGYPAGTNMNEASSTSKLANYDKSVISPGWHWWNFVGNLGLSAGGYNRLYRDGILVVEQAPDTVISSLTPGEFVLIHLGNSASTTGIDITDLIVRDDTNLIPDTRVDVLAPTSDVAAGWTRSSGSTNFSLVDDAGPTVDTSDYVSANAAGLTDIYGMENLPTTPDTISAVGVHAIGRKDSGGARTAAMVVNSNEGAQMPMSNSGTLYNYWETNPSGGAAWTKADIDAMTAGITIKI